MYCTPLVIFYQKKVQSTKERVVWNIMSESVFPANETFREKNAKKIFAKSIGDEAVNVNWAKKTCGILCSESSTLEA